MKRIMPWLMIAVLWNGIFALSCQLLSMPTRPCDVETEGSIASQLFGASRLAISGQFYEAADKYFHRGVAHRRDRAFNDTIFQRLLAETSPEEHLHLHGHDMQEMMPWLWLSIKMNPQRAETYLVAAFWLSQETEGRDLALRILQKAQANIPFNYEVQLEKGRLLLRLNRLTEAAVAFDAGLAFWPSGTAEDDEAVRYDRASLLLYRALLYEVENNANAAISALQEILQLFPKRTSLQSRIDALKSGQGSALLASSYWKQLMKTEDSARASQICSQAEGAHEKEGHQHDDHSTCEHE